MFCSTFTSLLKCSMTQKLIALSKVLSGNSSFSASMERYSMRGL